MGWVKEANRKYKFCRYEGTRHGFRIYTLLRRQTFVYFEDRPDGRYRITEFTKGKFIGINRDGLTFIRPHLSELWYDIDLFKNIGHISSSSNRQP